MENTEYQTTLALRENITFDEKVEIEDLVLPSEQTGTPSMENIDIKEDLMDPQFSSAQSFSPIDNNALKEKIDIKEEPLDIDFIPAHERTKQIVHAFLHHEKQDFQSEIERKIEKLFGEFDMMSMREYDLTRVKKVKQLFEKYQTDKQNEQIIDDGHILEKCLEEKSNELTKIQQEFQKTKAVNFGLSQKIQELEITNNQISSENISLKAKVEEITKEHKTVIILNAKNISSIFEMHEKRLEDKTNGFNKIKKELYSENVELKEEIARFTENRKNITENKLKEKSYKRKLENVPVPNEKPRKIKKINPVSNCTNPAFKCEICDLKTTTKSNLSRHKRNKHGSKEKNFHCDLCESKFITKERLRNHTKLYHEDEKLECSICNALVIATFGLKRHMKTHAKIKPN